MQPPGREGTLEPFVLGQGAFRVDLIEEAAKERGVRGLDVDGPVGLRREPPQAPPQSTLTRGKESTDHRSTSNNSREKSLARPTSTTVVSAVLMGSMP